MSTIIEPFKCDEARVSKGVSCATQKEIWDNLNNLMSGNFQLPVGSIAVGSGLGDASWNEALNYEKIQTEKNKEIIKEAEEKSVDYISNLESKTKNKDYLIYGVATLLVLGVIIYEFKSRK
jgi:basic membrane lipoprotein Med (substrate-binding protein (PBP1-ABC) superfamily)